MSLSPGLPLHTLYSRLFLPPQEHTLVCFLPQRVRENRAEVAFVLFLLFSLTADTQKNAQASYFPEHVPGSPGPPGPFGGPRVSAGFSALG